MAITKVASIRTSISKTLNYCIGKAEMLGGINCHPDFAKDQFFKTKERFNKLKGRSGYHAVQSFSPGEVSVELAHEIGLQLAEKMWGDKYEVVVATHTDRKHIHNHFVINSVSFVDGIKIRFPKPMNKDMAEVSDSLCKEHNLSVIDLEKSLDSTENNSYLNYADWLDDNASGVSLRDQVKLDIDYLIDSVADLPELIAELEELGYEFKLGGKYPALKPPYGERFIRFKSLGAEYDLDKLFLLIHDLRKVKNPAKHNPVYKMQTAWSIHFALLKKRPGSFANLLKHYQLFLKKFVDRPLVYPTAEAKKSANRILTYQREFKLLDRKHIKTYAELKELEKEVNSEITDLEKERNKLYLAKKEDLSKDGLEKLNDLNKEIKNIRKEQKLIKQIIRDVDNAMVNTVREDEEKRLPEQENIEKEDKEKKEEIDE